MLSNLVRSTVAEVMTCAIRATHSSLLEPTKNENKNHQKENMWPQCVYNDLHTNAKSDIMNIE